MTAFLFHLKRVYVQYLIIPENQNNMLHWVYHWIFAILHKRQLLRNYKKSCSLSTICISSTDSYSSNFCSYFWWLRDKNRNAFSGIWWTEGCCRKIIALQWHRKKKKKTQLPWKGTLLIENTLHNLVLLAKSVFLLRT